MTKLEHVAALVDEGLTLTEIAKQLGMEITEVIAHVSQAVDQGTLLRTRVCLNLPKEFRQAVQALLGENRLPPEESRQLADFIAGTETSPEEFRLYLRYDKKRVHMGELYELLSEIECDLHRLIKVVLAIRFGENDPGWWRQGVPQKIREACAAAREADPEPADHPYQHTTLTHLREILDKQWSVFSTRLPKEVSNNKNDLLKDIERLKSIRNHTMHPVRSKPPTEDDFEFVRTMHRTLRADAWRLVSTDNPLGIYLG